MFLLLSSLLSFGANSEKATASYVVQKHDILGYISLRHYGTSRKWKKIARWNNIENPRFIRPGQKLHLWEAPTISLAEGLRLVAAAKEKRRQVKSLAQNEDKHGITPAPRTEERTKNSAQVANATYGKGNYSKASVLFAEERKKNPERVTAWLYELSSLKLSGNSEKFLELKKDFLKRFPNLAQLELLSPPRRLASKPR